MSDANQTNPTNPQISPLGLFGHELGAVREHWWWFLLLGIFLVVLGTIASRRRRSSRWSR